MTFNFTTNTPIILFLTAAFVIGITGCDKKVDQEPELVILCGSSFVNPTKNLYQNYAKENNVRFAMTASGSEDFLPQVKEGGKGDILVTHDPYLDYTIEANRAAGSVNVGYVAPVIAVQPGNPQNIRSIKDLTRPGLRVGISNPEYSTCGEMVFDLLEKKGIKEDVLKNVGNRLTKGHSTLCNWLKTDAVDAVVAWNGVAHTFKDSVEIIPTPYEYDTEIRVHVIGLNYSEEPDALSDFLEYVKENGPEIYSRYGYVK